MHSCCYWIGLLHANKCTVVVIGLGFLAVHTPPLVYKNRVYLYILSYVLVVANKDFSDTKQKNTNYSTW